MMRWLKHSTLPASFLLGLILFLLLDLILAAFINGPVNLHQHLKEQTMAEIEKAVPEIQGLERTEFAYITWQGHDATTLYWFDAYGKELCTRPLSLLNYQGVQEKAAELGIEMEEAKVQLCYGYNYPAYSVENASAQILFDFDTLQIIYERENGMGGIA